jgi:uncharacterized protein YeaO (DUF488 family)
MPYETGIVRGAWSAAGNAVHRLKTKRVYDGRSGDDGTRILVDRLWPRGLSREKAAIDAWRKDLAPSDELRKWYGHRPERWAEFRRRYLEELAAPERREALREIEKLLRTGTVTLVYAAKDEGRNNAVVLAEVVQDMIEWGDRRGEQPQRADR